MKKKAKVLFVSQEIFPYMEETHISKTSRHLPQAIQEKGKEIRVFMPRYGNINERRHSLHEVIRLSGMNLIISDSDHPLIIKVASIQSARMQVYFIDNDDFFSRKHGLKDEKGKPFDDNDERAIFFVRGVVETIKKLGWQPDIIHCQGWFTGFMPLFIKKAFNDNPMFVDTKVVFSLYEQDEFAGTLDKGVSSKLVFDGITAKDVKQVNDPTYLNVCKLAIDYSDGIILGSEKVNPELVKHAKKSGKLMLSYKNETEYVQAYNEFYDAVLEGVEELEESK
ncbi:MAG TPA: glycogen/starch synthase [Bacteroidia bacterium]|nr:glycogen/starch synthase [Bacteroidia bacterium]